MIFLLVWLLAVSAHADAAKNTWVTKNGYRYYYNAAGDKVRSRLKKIGNAKYYFDKNGRMLKKTMRVIRGKRYYFRKGGKAATGWITFQGKKYYFNKEGVGQTGLTTIGKNKYYFDDDGVMQTGWQYFDGKKAYFYLKTGKMAVNRTIDGQKIGKQGVLEQSKADKSRLAAEEKAGEILKSITNSSMSKSQTLRVA